ncbi:formate/nitrite transporter family protein [Corynebacterium diphtheriae]|nr:formate/nitrite transporter family protein [Corynebacterium diphtheriae]CAB0517191.1 formate/nitrite transporter family protein [Corynebacterium diphtheriae]CAB0905248.1 formate/nitrite transporter family protein [Corynebacterium diphtheriae]CAB0956193.1 formate/nitrite transporter family protein [Corynebacterium diphtheriae]
MGKLEKDPAGLLVEGMLANFVFNMAIIGAVFAKEIVSKFFVIVPIIACFVGLSLEHVIANFCLMTLTFFCSTPLPDGFTLGAVLTNWSLVWIGNVIGGGFLIGGVYAWLNKDPEVYRD